MTISESQLEIWSHQGAITTSQTTHLSVRSALERYNFSQGVTYDDYLQGSYRNSTNIYGNSDVDLVAELTSVFYHNDLDEVQKNSLNLSSASYSLADFRGEVIDALRRYFGAQYVDTSGSKSIKVLPNGNRLKSDVVVAAKYRHYEGTRVRAEGIRFNNTQTNQEIINYPKIHLANGVTKNTNTSQWYKPTLRIFKNAREHIHKEKSWLAGKFPSYFIECLLYNVPNGAFGKSYQSTFCNIVTWLDDALNGNTSNFVCQNEMYYLFGSNIVQWNVNDAKTFVSELANLWNT